VIIKIDETLQPDCLAEILVKSLGPLDISYLRAIHKKLCHKIYKDEATDNTYCKYDDMAPRVRIYGSKVNNLYFDSMENKIL